MGLFCAILDLNMFQIGIWEQREALVTGLIE